MFPDKHPMNNDNNNVIYNKEVNCSNSFERGLVWWLRIDLKGN
jgi:hypothetical protein